MLEKMRRDGFAPAATIETSPGNYQAWVKLSDKPLSADVRRVAALATFHRLRPSNDVTVEEFLTSLQAHAELWAVVSSLGIVDFAQALAGVGGGSSGPTATSESGRRTRLTESQKGGLKEAIARVLADHPAGMSRTEVTAAVIAAGLIPAGIEQGDLQIKVRQPLHELVAAGQIHTVGEKRLMKYLAGPPSQTK